MRTRSTLSSRGHFAPFFYKAAAPSALAALLLHTAAGGVARAKTAQELAVDASPAPSVTAQGVGATPGPRPATPPAVAPGSPNAALAPDSATTDPNGAAAGDKPGRRPAGKRARKSADTSLASALTTGGGSRGNVTVANFAQAKVHLQALYTERPRTLYTDCPYTSDKKVDYDQCHFRPKSPSRRAMRIEWEHVVPAEAFGQAFSCWREGHPDCVDADGRPFRGRRCAQRASATYRLMEADLYNLYPEIGEVNQLRSNKPMGEPIRNRREVMPPSASFVGSDAFLPRPEVRGDVARTYRYMDATYPGLGIVGRKREGLFEAWDKADPVDGWECRRAWRIEAIQGNENPFVKVPCLEAGLWPAD